MNENENNGVNKEITPSMYFEHLKGSKNQLTTELLKQSYEVFLKLGEKYNSIGQTEALKKLCFLADTLKNEEKLIELGITTYVYKDAIEDYIENVENKAVKIVELQRYMREIPDELVSTIEKTKGIFDKFYIIFTDYTGKAERQTQKERRDRDPILFGAFKNNNSISDRFYFLGDWIDEYCDLTLDKMVEKYKAKHNGESPTNEVTVPSNADELIGILKTYKIDDNGSKITVSNLSDNSEPIPLSAYKVTEGSKNKKSFFGKIRTIFNK